MACISLNRACTRVVQDKLYQLLINKNQNQIYRQSRNHFNSATGSVILTNRNNFNDIGFNSIARNLSGTKQVNKINKKKKKKNNKKKTTNYQTSIPNHYDQQRDFSILVNAMENWKNWNWRPIIQIFSKCYLMFVDKQWLNGLNTDRERVREKKARRHYKFNCIFRPIIKFIYGFGNYFLFASFRHWIQKEHSFRIRSNEKYYVWQFVWLHNNLIVSQNDSRDILCHISDEQIM